MPERNFRELLENKWSEGKFVCVGLDSEFSKIPESVHAYSYIGNQVRERLLVDTIVNFNRAIVEATHNLVCAYKPNTAFYEAHGTRGIAALHRTIMDIHAIAPDVPVILDAKRADIGNTNSGYVQFAFDYLETDVITVHSYLGAEALAPFLERSHKGIFVLCRTSNQGAGEFQDLLVNDEPFYSVVARRVASKWNTNGNCGLVVGATYPEELRRIREIAPTVPILIPGIGAQGGDVGKTVMAGKNSYGAGFIINSSRGIIFASDGPDFAQAARQETEELHRLINQYL